MSDSDVTPAEFVGGPVDGQQRIVPGEPSELFVDEFKDFKIVQHVYVRRRINGIGVRLPSGMVPYDWKPDREQLRP